MTGFKVARILLRRPHYSFVRIHLRYSLNRKSIKMSDQMWSWTRLLCLLLIVAGTIQKIRDRRATSLYGKYRTGAEQRSALYALRRRLR